MLLKALLTRMSGGAATNTSKERGDHRRFSKLAFEKYKDLSLMVVQLLQKSVTLDPHIDYTEEGLETRQVEKAYPAMEIIERVGVPRNYRAVIKKLLMQLLGNRVWNLREKAAKTLSLLVDDDEILEEVRELCVYKSHDQNAVHGRLLYLKYMLCDESRKGNDFISLSPRFES